MTALPVIEEKRPAPADAMPACALPDSPLAAALPGINQCVHCGFCLRACPTYLTLEDENESPRGRIFLMRSLLEGTVTPHDEAVHAHIDRCLGCRACEPACPSGVPYGHLLEATRATLRAAKRPPFMLLLVLRVLPGVTCALSVRPPAGGDTGGAAGSEAPAFHGAIDTVRVRPSDPAQAFDVRFPPSGSDTDSHSHGADLRRDGIRNGDACECGFSSGAGSVSGCERRHAGQHVGTSWLRHGRIVHGYESCDGESAAPERIPDR